jgi:hypothetical protein
MATINDAPAVFWERQLKHIETEIYKTVYNDILYRTLFPMKTDIPSWASTTTYYSMNFVGQVEVANSHAWDVKTVDVGLSPTTLPLARHRIGFVYTMDELAAAQAGNVNLSAEKPAAAREILERRHNLLTFSGDANLGIVGLFTDPNIDTDTVPNGTGGTPQWTTKTPDEIRLDITNIMKYSHDTSNGKFRASKLLLPPAQWSLIMSTPWSTIGDGRTIADVVVSRNPFLMSINDIVSVPDLTGSGAGGVDQMVAYNPRKDWVHTNMADEIRMIPTETFAENFRTIMTAKFGGLSVKQPLSLAIRDSI